MYVCLRYLSTVSVCFFPKFIPFRSIICFRDNKTTVECLFFFVSFLDRRLRHTAVSTSYFFILSFFFQERAVRWGIIFVRGGTPFFFYCCILTGSVTSRTVHAGRQKTPYYYCRKPHLTKIHTPYSLTVISLRSHTKYRR